MHRVELARRVGARLLEQGRDNEAATESYESTTTLGPRRRFTSTSSRPKGVAMSTSEESPPHELESGRVALWRLDQFRSLGFSDDDAWRLTTSGADLQLVRSLIAAHCPQHLAVRIVL
jgi:hypothetical protein